MKVQVQRKVYVPNIDILLFVREMIKINAEYTNPSVIINRNLINLKQQDDDLTNKRTIHCDDSYGCKRKRYYSHEYDIYTVNEVNEDEELIELENNEIIYGIPGSIGNMNKRINTGDDELNKIIKKLKRNINDLINDEIINNTNLSFNNVTMEQLLRLEQMEREEQHIERDVDAMEKEEEDLMDKIVEINKRTNKIIKMKEDEDIVNIYRWRHLNTLGEGSYGRVYLVTSQITNERRAFKRILINRKLNIYILREIYILLLLSELNSSFSSPNFNYNLEREYNSYSYNFLATCDSNVDNFVRKRYKSKNNVIEIDKIYFGKNRIYMSFPVFDYNLREYLSKYYKNGMDIELIKHVIKQLLEGVQTCHSNNIIHRDIKPENILISLDPIDIDNNLIDPQQMHFLNSSLCNANNTLQYGNNDIQSMNKFENIDFSLNIRHITNNSLLKKELMKIPSIDKVILSDFGLSRQLDIDHCDKRNKSKRTYMLEFS